jgi:hypothetical protein
LAFHDFHRRLDGVDTIAGADAERKRPGSRRLITRARFNISPTKNSRDLPDEEKPNPKSGLVLSAAATVS